MKDIFGPRVKQMTLSKHVRILTEVSWLQAFLRLPGFQRVSGFLTFPGSKDIQDQMHIETTERQGGQENTDPD